MDCAAQSRKSNLFRIAVFNHIFHFVQRQRQPNSPTPPVPPSPPSPPSSPSLATRQDSQLPAPCSLHPTPHPLRSFWLYKFALLGIGGGGVVCAELLDKKGSNAVPLCALPLSPSLSSYLHSLALFSAHFACATKEVLERKRKSRKTAHRLNCI